MTIASEIREQIRQAANFACEFCGITETDIGDVLTIDHFQPRIKGGGDEIENLLYCCMRCNQYKLDYWPNQPTDIPLWNPHTEPFEQHFLELDDGMLHALTATGDFTLRRLRLNRPHLVTYRLRRRQRTQEVRLLTQYHALVETLMHLQNQTTLLMLEQQELLKEQQRLLRLIMKSGE